MATKKCYRCKINLPLDNFIYRGKNHKTCESCANKRKKVGKLCEVCNKIIATFGYENKKPLRCKECSWPNMIDVINHKCIVCKKKQPSFNYENEIVATHCKKCSLPNMIDIKSKRCIVCKKKRQTFNFPDEENALYCGDCKLPNMIDVKSKKCIVCNKKRPSFNYENEIKAIYCGDCKLTNMINIKDKKCIICKKKQPCFNYEQELKPTHCKNCKLLGMINIKDKKCIVCKKKQPCFNYENETLLTHCGDCKLPNMINIKTKKCIVCKKKIPNFNYENETIAIYCGDCKLPNMIDIKHLKCIICKKRANYGIPLNLPTRCSQHKEENMISNPRAKCKIKSCKEYATYGVKKPIHCSLHKNLNDINLVERKCKKCGKIDVLDDNEQCINFCSNIEKYKEYKKHQKVEEQRALKIISESCGKPDLIDSTIPENCNDKQRPDMIYDCKTHVLVIEIDEYAHKNYCQLGEYNRMVNIYMIYGGVPVIFLRYNPHVHTENGKRVKIPIAEKEKTLVKWVKYLKEQIPKDICSVIYLYYDENDNTQYYFDPYRNKEYNCDKCDKTFYIKEMYKKHKLNH